MCRLCFRKDGSKEVTQQTIIRNAEVANDVRVNLKQPFDLLVSIYIA
jgi:hypothetical protein